MAGTDMRYVSAKLAVLLALTTAARGCELTALTNKGMVFSGDLMVTLFLDPSFCPKLSVTMLVIQCLPYLQLVFQWIAKI